MDPTPIKSMNGTVTSFFVTSGDNCTAKTSGLLKLVQNSVPVDIGELLRTPMVVDLSA